MPENASRRSSRQHQAPARFRDGENELYDYKPPPSNIKSTEMTLPLPLQISPEPARTVNPRSLLVSTTQHQGAHSSPGLEAIPSYTGPRRSRNDRTLEAQITMPVDASVSNNVTNPQPRPPSKKRSTVTARMRVNLAYLTRALEYWQANQKRWTDRKQRRFMMKYPGFWEWNQKWARSILLAVFPMLD